MNHGAIVCLHLPFVVFSPVFGPREIHGKPTSNSTIHLPERGLQSFYLTAPILKARTLVPPITEMNDVRSNTGDRQSETGELEEPGLR